MIELISLVFASYIVTLIITDGSILNKPRNWVLKKTSKLVKGMLDTHPIKCRLCVGLYISIGITLLSGRGFLDFFIIYGASYFLATQERG